MAKKSSVSKDLIKKFGKSAFIMGSELKDHSNGVIRVSPKIDLITGGGIPGGSIVTLAGEPKCGKTLSALHILGKAQQMGREAWFINVEGRIKPRDLDGIACLDQKKLNIVRSYRDENGQSRILKADEFLEVAENIVNNNPGAVIVIDSISQLVTGGEMDNELSTRDRAPGAILMAKFCRRISNILPVNDVVLIGILHFIANTSGFGKSKVVSGGNKIKYAMDVGLECKRFTIIRENGEEGGRPIGQTVEWTTTSSAFAPPGLKATSTITYGIGLDELVEMFQIGIDLGFINQAGSWFRLSYMEDCVEDFDVKKYQIQGEENMINRLRTNEYERKCLQNAYHEMFRVD